MGVVRGKTQDVATRGKTARHTRPSALHISNKDPNFEYSMRRKKEIEDGGGQDMLGYEPVGAANYNGEIFGNFPFQKTKTQGHHQYAYLDTILCKRPNEVTQYFKEIDDDRYNSQIQHVLNASKDSKQRVAGLRGSDSFVSKVSKSNFSGPGMTQRKGPTEE